MLIKWSQPSYPTATPVQYKIEMYNTENEYTETVTTNNLMVAFDNLNATTTYRSVEAYFLLFPPSQSYRYPSFSDFINNNSQC